MNDFGIEKPTLPIDRQQVRRIVEQARVASDAKAKADGLSPYQALLDVNDAVAELVKDLAPHEQEEFYRVYTEETKASSQQAIDEIQRIGAENAQKQVEELESAAFVQGMVWFVIMIVIFLAFAAHRS